MSVQCSRLQSCCKENSSARMANNSWVKYIKGALTVQVILDFLLIWDATRNIMLQPDVQDKFLWRWTADQYNVSPQPLLIGLSSSVKPKFQEPRF